MRSTKSIVAVLVAAGLMDESDMVSAMKLVDATMDAETESEADAGVQHLATKLGKSLDASKVRKARRESDTTRVAYWLTKVGKRTSTDDITGKSTRPVFKALKKSDGRTKREVMDITRLERGQTENAIYELQTRGLVESREQ